MKSKKTIAIDKENVFSYLYPNEVYSEKKIRYTISFFFKVVKDFLAYQEFILERVNQQVFLLKSLRKKNTERLFEQEFRKAEHNLESDSLRNQQFHFLRFLLQEEKYSYALRNSRGANTGLQESSESLNLFFIANVLRQETHGLTQKALGQSDFKSAFLPAIEQYLSKNKHLESPAILVYYELIKVLTTGNSLSTFQSLRKLISENGHHFPPNELREIYIFALNYCIKKINAREALFNREAFEIYKQGILQGVFIENGILSRFNYKNIVAAGLSVQEFDWVQHFIEKYKPYLEKKYRKFKFKKTQIQYKGSTNELKNIFDDLYDVNLHIHEGRSDNTIIEIRYYLKSNFNKVYANRIKNKDPMLHSKLSIPPYHSDKTKKFDVNWELGGIRHKLKMFIGKLKTYYS